ncbi:MAG: hypothetical protein A2146_00645 [Actinobacteria bacterium RBG_16_67_10]|nr:MAG: hypothetical protein A2146_00645 [Actinobacteria bacterium RBG_16_67_10]
MANAESEYMGGRKAKLWTYMILMIVLVSGAVIVNFAVRDPELAKKGVESFLGMPRWAFPSIGVLVGLGVYWIGLKIETDWPEAVGAFLIAGSVAAGEFLIGWQKFAFAGMVVVPYAIPILVFVILLMVGIVKSK